MSQVPGGMWPMRGTENDGTFHLSCLFSSCVLLGLCFISSCRLIPRVACLFYKELCCSPWSFLTLPEKFGWCFLPDDWQEGHSVQRYFFSSCVGFFQKQLVPFPGTVVPSKVGTAAGADAGSVGDQCGPLLQAGGCPEVVWSPWPLHLGWNKMRH